MKIPSFLLSQKAVVEPYQGNGAYGPMYGASFTADCRIEPKRQLVRDREGNEIVSEVQAWFAPGTNITAESAVTWNGRKYTVIEAKEHYGIDEVAFIEAVLR